MKASRRPTKAAQSKPATVPSAPRRRPDRKVKLQTRKQTQETVVKACLLRAICGSKDNKLDIRRALRLRVAAYSRRVHAASLGLLHVVQARFDGVDEDQVATTPVPDITDQSFVRQLMLGTAASIHPIACVQTLHEEHPEFLVNTPRYQGDRNIYSAGATLCVTNIKTHLRLNLERFIKKTVYAACDADVRSRGECTTVWADICGFNLTTFVKQYPLRREDAEFVARVRSVLGLTTPGASLSKQYYRLDDNLPRILRAFVLLNRRLAELDAPVFALLPVAAIRTHFISVDTSVLAGLLKDVKIIRPGCDAEKYDDLGEMLWRSTFKVQQLEGKSRKFTGTLNVDGISLCMHQTRAITDVDTARKAGTNFQPEDEDRVLGLDPGRKAIITMVEVLPNGRTRVYTLTRNQYYREAGILDARRHTDHWHDGIRSALRALSQVSSKGAGMVGWSAFVQTYLAHETTLWIEYLRPRWAQQRMRLYGGKKRVFARFFNEVERGAQPGQRTVIAYGSAKFAPGGKGELAVPTSRAYKECSYRFATVPVCEFRTTKVHHGTWTVLQRVVKQNGRGRGDVRGLLWYSSTTPIGTSKFVNRDVNAALNIRHCLINNRPEMLTRRPDQPALVLQVGKVIRR